MANEIVIGEAGQLCEFRWLMQIRSGLVDFFQCSSIQSIHGDGEQEIK
jgi:hypothetical protein